MILKEHARINGGIDKILLQIKFSYHEIANTSMLKRNKKY